MNSKIHKVLMCTSMMMGLVSTTQVLAAPERTPTKKVVVNDDCSFIRNAIDSLPSKGGVVKIPAGKYDCAAPIVIDRDNVTVRGAGSEKVTLRLKDFVHAPLLIIGNPKTIKTEDGKFVTEKRVNNIVVSGLTLDGNRDNHDVTKECGEKSCDGDTDSVRNNGITIRGASHVLVENVVAHSTISGGMVTEKYCDHLTVRNFESYNHYFDGFAGYETEKSTFTGMYLHHNRGAGISIDINFSRNVMSDSRLHKNGDVGIFARFLKFNQFVRLDIQDSGNHGVFLADDGQPDTCASDNIFDSVTINGSKRAGIRVNDHCTGNRVIGNSNLCLNTDGAVSEKVSGSVIIDNTVACREQVITTDRR